MVLYLLNMGVLMNWQLIVVADLSHYHWQKYFLRTPNVKRFAGYSKKSIFSTRVWEQFRHEFSSKIVFFLKFYVAVKNLEDV